MYSIIINSSKVNDWQKAIVIFNSGERTEAKCKITKLEGNILFIDVDLEKNIDTPKKRVGGTLVPIDKNLQNKLKTVLKEHDISILDVAKEVGCSDSTINNFLSGKYERASSDVVLNLKNFLGNYI